MLEQHPLLARGRDRLETASDESESYLKDFPLLARGRDRLETKARSPSLAVVAVKSPTR